jgi:hypothetical protein
MKRERSRLQKRVVRTGLAVAFGVGLSAAAALLARSPESAEYLWGAFGPRIAFGLSKLTAPLPFALAELAVAAWIVVRLIQVACGVVAIRRAPRSAAALAGGAALSLLRDAGLLLGLFQLLWGFGYLRAPLEERPELAAHFGESHRDAARLAALAERAVVAANDAYVVLHGVKDRGTPTAIEDPRGLEAGVEQGWQECARTLGLSYPAARRHGPAKRLLISPLLRFVGLAGVYSPFTGEATVNAGMPALDYAHAVAHEKAHQRGVNREDEADFLGWLAAVSAPDPLARYAAAVEAQRELLRALMPLDRQAATDLVARRHPGVQRDIDDLTAYWAPAEGRLGRFGRRVNDAFLKSNRVDDGIASYDRSLDLLLAWADRHGDVFQTGP